MSYGKTDTKELASSRETIRLWGPGDRADSDDAKEVPKRQASRSLLSSRDLFTVVPILLTCIGMVITLLHFDKQMRLQRLANAEALVNQFYVQVAELSAQAKESENAVTQPRSALSTHIRRLIVSRAQMLIDSSETGHHTGDILRFLAANDFGQYIGRKPNRDDFSIRISYSSFSNTVFDHAILDGAHFICLSFDNAKFDRVDFINGSLSFAQFHETLFSNVDFSNSEFANVDFKDSLFAGSIVFDGAAFRNSDLSRIIFGGSGIQPSAERTIQEEQMRALGRALAGVSTLVGTRLSDSTREGLLDKVGPQRFNELTTGESGRRIPVAAGESTADAWNQICRPKLRPRSI